MTADPDTRRRELAQIHIARGQLGMAEDSYRDILFTVARVRSAADLDHVGRKAVLDHLKACGWKASAPKAEKENDRRPNEWAFVDRAGVERQPLLRKIIMLARASGVGRRYVDGIASKMFDIERREFCAPDQLYRIVTALEFDRRRREKKVRA